MDTILVILIVGLAACYVGRRFYNSIRRGSECGCGCSGCTLQSHDPEMMQCHGPETTACRSGQTFGRSSETGE